MSALSSVTVRPVGAREARLRRSRPQHRRCPSLAATGHRRYLVRTGATEGSNDSGDGKPSSSVEPAAEPELETWQKSWVRQNPGRPLSEMPSEEPKFNSDNFGALSIATGGVSFLALGAALWLAQQAQELRSLSPEELAARFGDDLPQEASGLPSGAPPVSAPPVKTE
uniref:Uncharacterized protein n=1 Tax=Tetraselmis chuii TaxID=63592 RepID=A0A7S1XA27_9CHLO|mmetsp:Transcript_5650/g.10145  ORF Transcript_5650/g.10145 Transcript_5650/m.10145 type:complete len:168 (+) Transcript_5650:113-616(+)